MGDEVTMRLICNMNKNIRIQTKMIKIAAFAPTRLTLLSTGARGTRASLHPVLQYNTGSYFIIVSFRPEISFGKFYRLVDFAKRDMFGGGLR